MGAERHRETELGLPHAKQGGGGGGGGGERLRGEGGHRAWVRKESEKGGRGLRVREVARSKAGRGEGGTQEAAERLGQGLRAGASGEQDGKKRGRGVTEPGGSAGRPPRPPRLPGSYFFQIPEEVSLRCGPTPGSP